MSEKLGRGIRREQIAEAALDLITAQGGRRLSMGAVARRVGVVPSALYRHFTAKGEILSAAIERMGERLLENASQAIRKETTALGRLKTLLDLHVGAIREGYAEPRILFAGDIGAFDLRHREEVYRVIRRYADMLSEIVRQGQRAGEIRKDVDSGTAALGFLGLVQPAATLWHLSGGVFDAARHAERAFALYADALKPR